jgi:hypothetical protein
MCLVRNFWRDQEDQGLNTSSDNFMLCIPCRFVDIRTVTLVRKGNDGDSLPASAPVSSDKENWKTRSFLKSRKEGSKIALKDEVESQIEQAELPAVRDHAIRDKVMYHSEKFDPKVFLARIHQNTSAADLEAGEDALREDLQSRKNQLKKLVKDHFDCFISCKNTIDDIHTKLQQIESAGEGTGTLHLSNAIQEVDSVAKRAFAPLLERQAQAERIRSVQGMLQRFRTLFNLPSMIRANISKGEYDLAIREYKKAKSLVLYSHVRQIAFCLQITAFHADREKKALLHSLQYLFHHYLMCTAWRMAGNLRSQSCYMFRWGF